MKNFKRVLSLALAALMVIGGLVIAPVDAKADDVTFTKVTSASEITAEGLYVIVATKVKDEVTTYHAMGTTLHTSSGYLYETTVTIDGNAIAAGNSAVPVWTIAPTTGGFTIKTDAGYLSAVSGKKLATVAEAGATEVWTIADGEAGITISCGAYDPATDGILAFNSSSPRFKTYANTYTAGVTEFTLYKASGVPQAPEAGDVPTVTPDSPAADIVNAAYALKDGEKLEGYTLEGKVTNVDTAYDAGYGNITVTIQIGDMADKKIQCYRLKGDTVNAIVVGDTIKVSGNIVPYTKDGKTTIQFASGCKLVAHTSELPAVPALKENATATEILVAAAALGKDQCLKEQVTMTGKIVTVNTAYSEQYGNITVTIQVGDKETDVIECFRLKGEGVDTLALGDTIKVKGTITNYKGTKVEFNVPTLVEKVTVPAEPDQPTTPPMGDMNTVGLYIVLFAGAALVTVSVLGKKKMA